PLEPYASRFLPTSYPLIMYKRSVATLVCPFAPFLVPKPASHVFQRSLFAPTAVKTASLRRTTSRRSIRRRKESLRYDAQRYDAQRNAAQRIVGDVQVWAQKLRMYLV